MSADMLITYLSSIVGFLVALLLFGVKSWQKKHDLIHSDIDHRIDKLTECVSVNKRDISSWTTRCDARCKNEDLIFVEIKTALKESMDKIDGFIKIVGIQNEKIIRLQEKMKQFDRRSHDYDDDQK